MDAAWAQFGHSLDTVWTHFGRNLNAIETQQYFRHFACLPPPLVPPVIYIAHEINPYHCGKLSDSHFKTILERGSLKSRKSDLNLVSISFVQILFSYLKP